MKRIAPARIQEQYKRYLAAWEALAPKVTLGKKTVIEFADFVALSEARRAEIDRVEATLDGMLTARDNADDVILEIMEKVKNSVIDNEDLGSDDGALYEALGYVPKSKRKTGNTRKKTPGS
jgi:hypothetical protein